MPSLETVFMFVNALALGGWVLLILFPRLSWTQKIVHAVLIPVILGSVYLLFMIYAYFHVPGNPDAGFTSIKGVQTLFSEPVSILIGWTHYLVFDLFVGAWISRDAFRRRIHHLATVPCLLFTYMLGPIGLLMYVGLRKITGKGGWSLNET